MYEKKKTKTSFRDIALQLLIIVLFILVLLWLFPTKKNINKYFDNNKNNNSQQTKQKNTNVNNDKNNNLNTNDNNFNVDSNSKSYEYVKEMAGTYGEYGTWSNWSTNYVAASNTIDVQTDVRRVQTGTTSYQVKVGTSVNNEVIGNIKDNKVFSGYNYNFIREIKTNEPLSSNEKYLYVLRQYEKNYDCSSGKKYTLKSNYKVVNPTYPLVDMPTEKEIQLSQECPNYKLYFASYIYGLYEIVPIYTTSSKDVYGNVEKAVMETKTNAVYNDVIYYRYRTREYIEGSKDIKWSTSKSDQTLLNQGYKLTGNTK